MCVVKTRPQNNNISKETFVEKATKIHNNKYDYSLVEYKGAAEKINIVCKMHNINFFCTPTNHINRLSGCPVCAKRISKPEASWIDSLNNPNIQKQAIIYLPTYGGRRKYVPVDGLDLITNTVYEFYGDFWHGNPRIHNPSDYNVCAKKTYGELFARTRKKEACILSAGFNLVTMWESDFVG